MSESISLVEEKTKVDRGFARLRPTGMRKFGTLRDHRKKKSTLRKSRIAGSRHRTGTAEGRLQSPMPQDHRRRTRNRVIRAGKRTILPQNGGKVRKKGRQPRAGSL